MSKKKGPIDFPLFIIILVILSIGVIMVFSASMVEDTQRYNDSYYHLKRQLIWTGIGISAMFFTANLPYQKLRDKKLIFFGMVVTILLLIIVLFMPAKNGATRWIGIGSLGFQPSEIAKVMLVVYLADSIARKGEKIKTFKKGIIPVLFISGIFAGLILAEPNMSTAAIILATAFCLLIVGGAKGSQLIGIIIPTLAVGVLGALSEEYRRKRVFGFLDPWADPLGTGYQAIQSLYALGSGGLFGTGLGQSRQKWLYIPEAQNDFIFAIIGEELGFIGVLFVLMLFSFLIWRGMKIALNCKDKFGSLLAAGIVSIIAVQESINLLVVSSFMPVTGVPLPLISYGGSSLVFTLASLGILLNISRYTSKNGVD